MSSASSWVSPASAKRSATVALRVVVARAAPDRVAGGRAAASRRGVVGVDGRGRASARASSLEVDRVPRGERAAPVEDDRLDVAARHQSSDDRTPTARARVDDVADGLGDRDLLALAGGAGP